MSKQVSRRVTMACLSAAWAMPNAMADKPFYADPPNETHPWGVHDVNRPQPPVLTPGTFSSQEQPGRPPSDAIVLFDGTPGSLANWESDKPPGQPTRWIVRDGALLCVPGAGFIRSKQEFGDCQLHVEWAAPTQIVGNSQKRGNSGVFLMGMPEIQVLDNYQNPSYADGMAGAVYGVNPPAANALLAPGQWQVYDIIFRRPIYKNGQLVDSGHFTVLVNGVLVQDATPLEGGGGHKARSKDHPMPVKGPLKLQDHGNPVRFRNIWLRSLPPRGAEGGDSGALTPEATSAKKLEIAKSIRQHADTLHGTPQLMRRMEALCYDSNDASTREVVTGLNTWLGALPKDDAPALKSRKPEILDMRNALKYLIQFRFLPADLVSYKELESLIKSHNLDKP